MEKKQLYVKYKLTERYDLTNELTNNTIHDESNISGHYDNANINQFVQDYEENIKIKKEKSKKSVVVP
jgi:hypothetical protein